MEAEIRHRTARLTEDIELGLAALGGQRGRLAPRDDLLKAWHARRHVRPGVH